MKLGFPVIVIMLLLLVQNHTQLTVAKIETGSRILTWQLLVFKSGSILSQLWIETEKTANINVKYCRFITTCKAHC